MNKFSITFVALAAMAGMAFAQAKTGSAGGAAATGAGATVKAGAGAGSAGAKVGAGATAGAAAGSGSAAAAPKMEMPKPPAEIAATLKAMGNRMNCTGTTWGGADGKTEMKMKGTGTSALALDGWFIKGSVTMTMGEGKAKGTLKIDNYMTWDAKAGKWRSIGAANDGAIMVGTSEMSKDGKSMDSMSDMYGGMMGDGKFREHGDMSDPKAGMHMVGEKSNDGGKTWSKVYDMTCKK
jgi:hypothetical protein